MFRVFNETDQILAAPDRFKTKSKAQECIDRLRELFASRGSYMTAAGQRIPPAEVKLVIVPDED